MGPAAGFDEHGDLTGHRQSRGAARTELTHRVEIAHRPQVERRRLQARALEGCIHSRFEVPRQRLHGSWGRDPAHEDPLMHCGVWPSATRCRLGGCFQVSRRPADGSRRRATGRCMTTLYGVLNGERGGALGSVWPPGRRQLHRHGTPVGAAKRMPERDLPPPATLAAPSRTSGAGASGSTTFP